MQRQGLAVAVLLPGRGAKKPQLFPVTPAPFAQAQMRAQPEALANAQRAIQRQGLQMRCLPATRRKLGHPANEGA